MQKRYLDAKIRGFALIFLAVAGCTPIASTPTAITQNLYPYMGEVPPLPSIELKPFAFETPTATSFIALDFENWQNLETNLNIFKQRELLYLQRIEEINRQRAEWRKLNGAPDARSY